jgi:hypothetical protein
MYADGSRMNTQIDEAEDQNQQSQKMWGAKLIDSPKTLPTTCTLFAVYMAVCVNRHEVYYALPSRKACQCCF